MEVWGEWITEQFKETGEFQSLVPSHGFALN
jgi:adenine-specific DNA methylase